MISLELHVYDKPTHISAKFHDQRIKDERDITVFFVLTAPAASQPDYSLLA
jgi:hypothetical protein